MNNGLRESLVSIEHADIEWEDNIPLSKTFADIYYSKDAGLAESRYVFIEQNHLKQRWKKLQEDTFVISEAGFGTGLNFLATCELWECLALEGKTLHYIAFEKYPLSVEALEKAYSAFPEIKQHFSRLLSCYPKRVPGFHRVHFRKNISLSLYFGDALEGIRQLEKSSTQVDAWYFDGFAPNMNESLWSDELFQSCQGLNKSGTSFATFTAAGHVKRKLQSIGFSCNKVKGFGRKREMLIGTYHTSTKPEADKNDTSIDNKSKLYAYREKPWLMLPQQTPEQRPKNVAIIGAGLAGAWTAYKLAQKNIQVHVFDAETDIAMQASGNPRGATYFKLEKTGTSTKPTSTSFHFYLQAYLYSINYLNELFPEKNSIWDASGLIQLAFNENQTSKQKQLQKTNPYKEIVSCLNQEEVCTISQSRQSYAGLFFPDAGSVNPNALCKFLLTHENIHLHLQQSIQSLNYHEQEQSWLLDKHPQTFDAVVLANSHAASSFEISKELPLFKVRGQSTQLCASKESKKLKTVICSKGYLTPAFDNEHVIGSSFDPRNHNTEGLESDNQTNLDYLKKYSPAFFESLDTIDSRTGKAALRCQTPDMLPLLGPLANHDEFTKDYAGIAKGQLKKLYPACSYWPGLYVNTGHASRGLISAPYCAEILANMMCQEPLACQQQIQQVLSPNRFYLNTLKRSQS